MQWALACAQQCLDDDEVPIGACVVDAQGVCLGQGRNQTITRRDPSAHAEIQALRAACEQRGNHRLIDCTLYVTLEPCVMCVGALIQARVRRVVFGAYDAKTNRLAYELGLHEHPALNHSMIWEGGCLEAPCKALLQTFFRQKR